jgi:Leucine-rich repeat (LRR) protein
MKTLAKTILVVILGYIIIGCEPKVEYNGYDENLLFSLDELYQLPTYRSLEEALKTPDSVYKIVLFNKGLKEVPGKVARLKYLNILELTTNELSDLPDWVGDMIYLQDLYVARNQFSEVPEAVFRIKNLKRVIFDYNQFTEIPVKILTNPNIEELHFGHNQITRIPDELYGMKQLKVLKLDENNIDYLDTRVGQLTSIKVLDVEGNNLDTLPFNEIINLPNLRTLNIRDNNLSWAFTDSLKRALPGVRVYR